MLKSLKNIFWLLNFSQILRLMAHGGTFTLKEDIHDEKIAPCNHRYSKSTCYVKLS